MTLTIVIITRNRPEVLAKCLERLEAERDCELSCVVVDNSDRERDETRKVVERLGWPTLLWVEPGDTVLCRGRNAGVSSTDARIIAFLDDDSMIDPRWVAACRATFDKPDVGAVGGRILDTEVDGLDHTRPGAVGRIGPNGEILDNFDCHTGANVDIDHIRGCNWAVRRDVFERLGGFDERLTGHCFEEFDLCLRIRRAGYRIVFNPGMSVYHDMAPRTDANARQDAGQRRHEILRTLTYVYAKNAGPCSGLFLRFLVTYRTHALAFAQSPSTESFGLALVGWRGKFAGLRQYLRCRSDLRQEAREQGLSRFVRMK